MSLRSLKEEFKEYGMRMVVRDVTAGVFAVTGGIEVLITLLRAADTHKLTTLDPTGGYIAYMPLGIMAYQAGKKLAYEPIRNFLGNILGAPVKQNTNG